MSLFPLGLISQGGGAGGGGAFELISTTILGTAAASVTFSSIASTYTHLQIRYTARSSSTGGDNIRMQMNADTGNNYSVHYLFGNGSSVSSGNAAPWNTAVYALMPYSTQTADVWGAGIIDILDYRSTSKNKTVRGMSGKVVSGDYNIYLQSGAWLSTSAITELRIYLGTGSNIVAGSRFSLYGVRGS